MADTARHTEAWLALQLAGVHGGLLGLDGERRHGEGGGHLVAHLGVCDLGSPSRYRCEYRCAMCQKKSLRCVMEMVDMEDEALDCIRNER